MKLLRLGNPGQEIPAAIDKNGKYRNLSSHIKDFNPETLNLEYLEKLKKIDLEGLEEIDQRFKIFENKASLVKDFILEKK